MKILISGGNGKFAKQFIRLNTEHEIIAPSKGEMDVTQYSYVSRFIAEHRPDIFLHAGALTRPMAKHETDPARGIHNNIIGTSNVTMACIEYKIKLIYISTDYVYPGTTGEYKETDALLPFNKYAWSKLGGECAVHMYDNSLILRICMNTRPFPHKKALVDIKKSLIYDDEAAKITHKLLNETGIINVGGVSRSVYDFVKEENPNIETLYLKDVTDVRMPLNTTLNIEKMKGKLNMDDDLDYSVANYAGVHWESIVREHTQIIEEYKFENYRETIASRYMTDNTTRWHWYPANTKEGVTDFLNDVMKKGIVVDISDVLFGNPFYIEIDDKIITQDLLVTLGEIKFLNSHVDLNKITSIVEVGAGYGRTAYGILKKYPHIKYNIVDIEPALSVARYHLNNAFPDNDIRYLTPDECGEIQNVDLWFSISAFAEFDAEQIMGYVKHIDRTSKYFYITDALN